MPPSGAPSAVTTDPTATASTDPIRSPAATTASDPVNHPPHYTWLPNGVEVIQITEHMPFCLGNVVKYVVRADHKGRPIEDLEKARFYLDREITRRKATP